MEVTFKVDSERTFEATLIDDGALVEIYIDGWYFSCVKKNNLSKEIIKHIEGKEND